MPSDNLKNETQLHFAVGGAVYAIPVSDVECVVSVPVKSITRLPDDKSGRILGLFNYRGNIAAIAVIEGFPEVSLDECEDILVLLLSCNGKRFGIAVDNVYDVSDKARGDIKKVLSVLTLYNGKL